MDTWIKISEKLPEPDSKVLVYKILVRGGYCEGIYIATYEKVFGKEFMFIIDDQTKNQNNYRLVKEFSHWMPLPNLPTRND